MHAVATLWCLATHGKDYQNHQDQFYCFLQLMGQIIMRLLQIFIDVIYLQIRFFKHSLHKRKVYLVEILSSVPSKPGAITNIC